LFSPVRASELREELTPFCLTLVGRFPLPLFVRYSLTPNLLPNIFSSERFFRSVLLPHPASTQPVHATTTPNSFTPSCAPLFLPIPGSPILLSAGTMFDHSVFPRVRVTLTHPSFDSPRAFFDNVLSPFFPTSAWAPLSRLTGCFLNNAPPCRFTWPGPSCCSDPGPKTGLVSLFFPIFHTSPPIFSGYSFAFFHYASAPVIVFAP